MGVLPMPALLLGVFYVGYDIMTAESSTRSGWRLPQAHLVVLVLLLLISY